MDPSKRNKFKKEIFAYYKRHRRDLPWRRTRDPYKIFVSEIMLQQTQVTRVRLKYRSFIKRFPDFASLARASSREILRAWQGLGYNRRALALKRASEMVVKRYHGKLPNSMEELMLLPGVGKATAGAILAYAFQMPVPFIETNIRRVFIHFFFPRSKKVKDETILKLIEALADEKDPREWYYAVVDFGAELGRGRENPNRRSAHYKKQELFKGSRRELRGKMLALFLKRPGIGEREVSKKLGMPVKKIKEVLVSLRRDGLVF